MAVAKSSSYTGFSFPSCSCYGGPSLRESILGANETGNLTDKYVLGEQLGWGQFGIIRECIDKFSGEVLACKSIAKDRLVTREDVRSIKLEIEIMSRLSGHPNVVDLKAVYEEENYVHLVMELCAGGELFHKLEKHGRFSEPEARVLFRHLMEVVMYCHDKGVVHRDLKPENILLSTKSSSSPIKLADFGLATYIRPGQNLHGTVGSPFYIAPEVLAGGYDQAADVWSAGVILYILLSGIPPFWGKTKSLIFDAVRAADLRFPSNPWNFISDSAKGLIKGMLCTDTSRRLTAQQVLAGEVVEDRKGGSGDARLSGIHGKRNHTIGLGEFEHLDLVVTESVIRWASCTHLPTATSFRTTLLSSYNNLNEQQLDSTATIKQPQIPESDVYNVKFQTLGACKLGISRYPDFEYNAEGGSAATTKFLGLPLPPFLKIEIVPENFHGKINQESGKVDLKFRAKFCFSVGSVYKAPALLVETVLTSEESKGKMRGGRGDRLGKDGVCRLVGVATVEPINDLFMDTFLSLPTECLANLNAIISFSSTV
ncbi:Calcium-dependent protein kinase [Sesamum angolense]|uniref:non-specific serine/threonine protein kinase n=1 Tax=Sesamum angolense TaxID=2727404 RepID=A0AAE2BGM0_9LAMI|nr:Calcium-dependent protein kinase [Sesamum angolense]